MNFINQITEAFKYTLRDWKILILLGIVLCLISSFEEFNTTNFYLEGTLLIITILLLFIEEGYRYRIIESTLNGNNKPPILNGIKELIKEGFEEWVTLTIYALIMLILNMIWNLIKPNTTINAILWMFVLILIIIFYITFFAAAINKILNGGKFLSAFNIKEIFGLYSKIGILKTILIVILGTINLETIVSCVIQTGVLNAYMLLDYTVSFFVSPILVLFLTRLIALCAKDAI